MRGEYGHHQGRGLPAWELPPRARRIHSAPPVNHDILGTTSACAENTTDDTETINMHGNYLRVRGEYILSLTWAKPPWELPPRARRIPHPPSRGRSSPGTTSACAENTGLLRLINPPKGNYLRVRGEYCSQAKSCVSRWELPPRARRIPPAADGIPQSPGTTSACAENTHKNTPCMIWRWNYLRVRGEYLLPVKQMIPPAELPPRARRIRITIAWGCSSNGTTSACAENTSRL